MTSRDAVLAAVRASRPPAVPKPDVAAAVARFSLPNDQAWGFIEAAAAAGARVVVGERVELARLIASVQSGTGRLVSVWDDPAEREPDPSPPPQSFSDTDVFVCEAVLGVAENGAVWLPLSRLRYRSAVFLATNVIVILDRANIVGHLHAAYEAIDVAGEGFGVFVAGPSKTADIEQALVIGAHGAKSLTVLLV